MTSTSKPLYEKRGKVAVIHMDYAPVNCIARPLRRHLYEALLALEGDESVEAAVLIGEGRMFSAGADVAEFDKGEALAAPTLHGDIGSLIESSSKPVVAAIHGGAYGGGFELALICHGRVATPDADLGLTEVKLGFMPGAGGTQRLPRAIGLERGISMMVQGRVAKAAEFAGTALLDQIAEGGLIESACWVATDLARGPRPLPLLSRRPLEHPEPAGFLAFARAQVMARRDRTPGMVKVIDAVEASLTLPVEAAHQNEYALFNALMVSPEAKALRHAFTAERAASKIDDLPAGTKPREIKSVGVVGAGMMGTGIALAHLAAGYKVYLHDSRPEALGKAQGMAAKDLPPEKAANLVPTPDIAGLAGVDLAIEAVFEDMAVKSDVLKRLDAIVRPEAVLASNTSSLDLDVLAKAVKDPSRVVGMHFFAPAQIMKLVEVVRGAATAPDVLATAMAVTRKLGKTAVLARVCEGFIGNRLFDQFLLQAMLLVEEGALPWQVDAALEGFGMRMGPFRVMDLIGNDLLAEARARHAASHPGTPIAKIADGLVKKGRLGQKSGSGWYNYATSRAGAPDPEVEALVRGRKKSLPKPPPAEAMVERCLLAMVNEGARVLEEGIAQRAADIDVAFTLGYGFPRLKGGPMFHAARDGLAPVERALRRIGGAVKDDRGFWTPAALIAKLAAEGKGFD